MHKFGHTGIDVTDMDESLAFYTGILKCELLRDESHPGMRLAFLDAGGSTIELVFKEENLVKPDGPVSHIAFVVENLDDEIETLKQNGISLLLEPTTIGNSRIIFFRGPNGEKLEFAELIA